MANALDDADWAMWVDFSAMRRALDRAVEARLQHDAGLSTPDFEILLTLSRVDDRRLRAGALAESLGWEKSRISHQVSRMAARGLVDRAECPTDARGTWVVLSTAGEAALEQAREGYGDVLRSGFFDRLCESDRAVMRQAALRVLEAVEPSVRPASLETVTAV